MADDGVGCLPNGAGSQGALRAANTRRVLDALAENGPMPQVALSRVTGLSRATISNIVARLGTEGVVTTTPTTSSGRRASLVRLGRDGRGPVAAGIDIGRRHIRVVLATVTREIVAERSAVMPPDYAAELGIEKAGELLDEALAEGGLDRGAVVGCGVGIPGPIDARTGRIAHGVILPEWVGFRPEDRLREALRLPVHLDNDANLGALAEVTWGPYVDVPDVFFLKVATGIGAGLVLSGEVYRGSMGITGEIGHISVSDRGDVCRCGNRGCLETVAATPVMIDSLIRARLLPRGAGVAELVELVATGDPAAERVLEDAGLALGQVVGMMVNLLNPQVVVLGGPLVPAGEAVLGPICRGLRRYASPSVSEHTQVVASALGERAEALGACSLVFRRTRSEEWTGLVRL